MWFQRNSIFRRWFSNHFVILMMMVVASLRIDPILSYGGGGSSYTSNSCLQLLSGQVGSGNYTYYRLSHEGDVSLTLHSVRGDADVYASQDSLQPTFDLNTHDLQSVTCGLDRVDIPAAFKRPVGIGIYGHPSHEMSSYQLCVNLLSSRGSWDDHHYNREGTGQGYDYNYYEDGQAHQRPRIPFYDKDDEEESILWTVLIGALKVLVEILT